MTAAQCHDLAYRIRRSVIDESYRAHVGHIGSALCIADILAVLYGDAMHLDGEHDRDRLVLSKGHAALALYAALAATERLSAEELASFCGEGSALGAHPEHVVEGIDFSTGSLGHGLSIGAGAALGARMNGSSRRTFVLLSDGELNEGSVWEAAMFAAHQRLGRLLAIVDLNGQQAFGYTREVLDLDPVAERWRAFGWSVDEIDGHDLEQLSYSLSREGESIGAPRIVIANTTFGKGVSYMESQIEWHYLVMSDEQYATALYELDAALAVEARARAVNGRAAA
jgi:transketolase